jgi:hypothetical protein
MKVELREYHLTKSAKFITLRLIPELELERRSLKLCLMISKHAWDRELKAVILLNRLSLSTMLTLMQPYLLRRTTTLLIWSLKHGVLIPIRPLFLLKESLKLRVLFSRKLDRKLMGLMMRARLLEKSLNILISMDMVPLNLLNSKKLWKLLDVYSRTSSLMPSSESMMLTATAS